MSVPTTTRRRRGASAAEFALVLPILASMILGMLDYGWFYHREAMVLAALNSSVRGASNVTPDIGETGCEACVETAIAHAVYSLDQFGITADREDLTPSILAIDGTCALVLDTRLAHQPLVSFVPVPTSYRVEVVAMLLNVDDC